MLSLFSVLFLAVGGSEAAYWPRLTCPYEQSFLSLQRVWCRQTSAECCTGFAFSPDAPSVDGGRLEVKEGTDSFIVSVQELSHGEGVYWCGLLSNDNTIIKLAEGDFRSSSGVYVWAVIRLIVVILLPVATIFGNIYFNEKTKHRRKKRGEACDDVTVRRPLADPQYENAASPMELE